MGENSSSEDIQKKGAKAQKNESDTIQKKSKIKALKSEFNKIMWPDKETVAKKTVAVVIATAALAIIIAMVDYMVTFGLDKLLSI